MYGLDSKDFEVLERLRWGLGIYDNVLYSRLRKLERWGYVEKHARGDYIMTLEGNLALQLGPDWFRRLSEKKKWSVIQEEEAPPALHRLAELKARIGPQKTLDKVKGIIIDPPAMPPLVRLGLASLAAKGIYDIIWEKNKDSDFALLVAFGIFAASLQ